MDHTYTVHNSLKNKLDRYIVASGFQGILSPTLLRDMACYLASYREEGISLYPNVFAVRDIAQLSVLAPGTKRIPIARRPFATITAAAILKECALLADRGWAIYLAAVKGKHVEYGLFRSSSSTLATTAEASMLATPEEPVLVFHSRGHLLVELRNSKSATFTASFTTANTASLNLGNHVDSFVEAMVAGVHADAAADFRPYASRLLCQSILRCHGTLLCVHVAPAEPGRPPEQFSRSTWLGEPLQWLEAHATAQRDRQDSALSDLLAVESIIIGAIASDGVVVFGNDGTFLAYRAFLSPTADELNHIIPDGGGRRRTFNLMKHRLGGALHAVLLRSQDGLTACEVAPNEH